MKSFRQGRRKEGLAVERIPVTVTVSRETGQIIQVERGRVKEKDFQRICNALIARGRGSGKSIFQINVKEAEEQTCRDGKRTD